MFDINKLKSKIKDQNQIWIKVEEFEFLYQKLGGRELIKTTANNATEKGIYASLYIDLLLDSIASWKGVKVKHILDMDLADEELKNHAEDEVGFDKEIFDQFLSRNLHTVQGILFGIEKAQVESNNKIAEDKKK